MIKNIITATALFFLCTSAVFFLSSCSEKTDQSSKIQSKAQVDSQKTIAEKQNNDKSPPAEQETYFYNPNGKVDPFVPVISDAFVEESPQKNVGSKKTSQDVPLTPLQKLEVSDFILVAVIATPKGLSALIEDPAMNGFIIKEGMQIGKQAGVIRKILSTSVLIEEENIEAKGNSEKKITTLTLRKK